MEVPTLLVLRLTADVDAECAVELLVGGAQDHAEERIAAAQLIGCVHQLLGNRIGSAGHGKGQQRLIGMQARVLRMKRGRLQVADGLDNLVGDDEQVLVDPRP